MTYTQPAIERQQLVGHLGVKPSRICPPNCIFDPTLKECICKTE